MLFQCNDYINLGLDLDQVVCELVNDLIEIFFFNVFFIFLFFIFYLFIYLFILNLLAEWDT